MKEIIENFENEIINDYFYQEITIKDGTHFSSNYSQIEKDKYQIKFYVEQILLLLTSKELFLNKTLILLSDGIDLVSGDFLEMKSSDDIEYFEKDKIISGKNMNGFYNVFTKNISKVSSINEKLIVINKYSNKKNGLNWKTLKIDYDIFIEDEAKIEALINAIKIELPKLRKNDIENFVKFKLRILAYEAHLYLMDKLKNKNNKKISQIICEWPNWKNILEKNEIKKQLNILTNKYEEYELLKKISKEILIDYKLYDSNKSDNSNLNYFNNILNISYNLGFFEKDKLDIKNFALFYRIPIELLIRDGMLVLFRKCDKRLHSEKFIFDLLSKIKEEFENDKKHKNI